MKILRISCSPRGRDAESHTLSEKIVWSLFERSTTAPILTDRMIGIHPVPHIDSNYTISDQQAAADISGIPAALCSEALIRELENADAVVIATPMHNFSVPSVLKAWIDQVVRAGRTFDVTPEGKVGTLHDRPVLVAVSSGGRYSGDLARQPDFLTTYLKVVLTTIGLRDIHFFSIQGTGLGPNVLAEARIEADRAINEYFSNYLHKDFSSRKASWANS